MSYSRSNNPIQLLDRFDEISSAYDALICDVWGVIHNGAAPFHEAGVALRNYREAGGLVLLLSNAPRPYVSVKAQLDDIGMDEEAYDGLLTSGDATHAALSNHKGQKVFHMGLDRHLILYEGHDIELTGVEEADLVVCACLYKDEEGTPDDYETLLSEMRARNLAMICGNPDLVVQRGDQLIYCAGSLARRYEEMGGTVTYEGKPHAPIYELARARINTLAARDVPKSKILAVGDGPKTDIIGANRFGVASLFVAGGIHGALNAKGLNAQDLTAIFETEGGWPTYAIPELR